MRRILMLSTLCLVVSAPFLTAHAFELPLGVVSNTDAGTGINAPSNLTTRVPFRIDALVPITVQPDVAAYICVETVTGYDAGLLLSDGGVDRWTQFKVPACRLGDGGAFGVRVEAWTAFPSSCGESRGLLMTDGGFASCVVGCVPVSGASVNCSVSRRQANHSPPEF